MVPGRKIAQYLLSATHRDGRHKAAFFRSFGFTLEASEVLAFALLHHVRTYDVSSMVSTPFGQNYVVDGPLPTPDGRAPQVRVVPGGLVYCQRGANGYSGYGVSAGRLKGPVEEAMIEELDSVVLTTDLPEHGLTQGDLGTVVLVHECGKGFTVEFMTLSGHTLAVVTLLASQVRPIASDEIAHARAVAVTA